MTLSRLLETAFRQIRRKRNQNSRKLFMENLEDRKVFAGDMVTHWNDIAFGAIRNEASHVGPTWASRNLAIVQTAVYDAVNAIGGQYTSFYSQARAPGYASMDAAVASAAYTTLVNLYPTYKTQLDNFYANSLATIPNGASEDAGVDIGRTVAQQILDLRTGDGSTNQSNYQVSSTPGHWQPDPTNPNGQVQQPLGPAWGEVKTFALESADQIAAPPPPALNSQEYADAYNEVKSLGAANSTTRTQDQTQIGIFWAYDRGGMGPPIILYNQIVQSIANQYHNDLYTNARLFALANVAMADAGISTWATKYEYDFWRPVTAIRRGAEDGNSQTVADPNWRPLGAPGGAYDNFTPPFPAYTSGHATFGSAMFGVLKNFYGTDNVNFTLSSDELPGVQRSYTSFTQAASENGRSRIYLGIHWKFDDIQGEKVGGEIADYVTSNFLVPKQNTLSVGVAQEGGGYKSIALPQGDGNLTVYRYGSTVNVYDNRSQQVVLSQDLSHAFALAINGQNQYRDVVHVNLVDGGSFDLPGGIFYGGGDNGNDTLWVHGTDRADQLIVDSDLLTANDLDIHLAYLGWIGLDARSGDDLICVKGEQYSRVIDIWTGAGDDTIQLSLEHGHVYANDFSGFNTLDFSQANGGANINAGLQNGQFQGYVLPQASVSLNGQFDKLIGSNFDDTLIGNNRDNTIYGLAGNDKIYGRGGNDSLIGGLGNDILFGEDGDDGLHGEGGNDILVGGFGADFLNGGAGDDLELGSQGTDQIDDKQGGNLIVTGSTTLDANLVALQAILAEWTSGRSYNERVANISGNGSGTRLNGGYYLISGGRRSTVRPDKEVDTVYATTSSWVISSLGDIIH